MTAAHLQEAPFRPMDLPDVWRFEDCCNVYVLRQGTHGTVIDLGSGAVLDHLPALGIDRVEGVYFTHAHRDQCQGADRALRAGIPLHFPAAARDFVDPDRRQDLRKPSPLIQCYPGRFEPPRPFCSPSKWGDGAAVLYDVEGGQRISFGDLALEVQAAPGHIDHQVAYLLDHADHRLCFSGDAIHSEKKLHEAYHWETDHYTGTGLRAGIETLRVLRQHRPDVLLPSHGPVTEGDLWPVFERTEAAMRRLAELKDTIVPHRPAVKRLVPPLPGKLQRVSEHLYVWNNSYFLVSDDGPVMMVDNAGPLPESFWEQYRAILGDRPIEVILITHIHCDHVEGVEHLRRGGWTGEVWAPGSIADCIESPLEYRRPWLPEFATRVDRRLKERFRFHEYEMTARAAPGQTDLHACYELTVDGHHAILSGDNFYPVQQWGGTGGLSGLNGGRPDHWRHTVNRYLRLAPEWVLASHIHPFEFRREDFLAMRKWCGQVSAAMRAIAPDGNLPRHHDPHLFDLRPHSQVVGPGETFRIRALWRNPFNRKAAVSTRLVLPEGWTVTDAEPAEWRATLQEHGFGFPRWEVRAGDDPGAFLLTADVTFDGAYLGEKAECYVHVAPP